ncbi:MAG: DUF1624 domain-containing protein [Acidobacteria bacterium]|nr:DUF1624 domain-containing protein [Acidobacteriota bacterium]
MAVLSAVRVTGRSERLDSIDLLRGMVILLMALDHTRDFFGDLSVDPMDPAKTWPSLFLTRWISHFCAPVFVFLAGTSAWLQAERKSPSELSYFLATRGLWLVFLELTWVRCFGWFFNFDYHYSVGQVIWAIGWAMVFLALAIRLRISAQAIALAGVVVIFLHNLTDGIHAEQFGHFGWLWRILHDRKNMEIAPGYIFFPQYPLLPWIAILFAGYGFGLVFRDKAKVARIGLAATALFLTLRLANFYGDPRPWAGGVYSYFNCLKYPPSLLYILMTLGPALLLFSRLPDTVSGVWKHVVLFGRVPLFFYLLHLPLIHGAAVVYAFIAGQRPDFGLVGVYAVWCMVLVLLYPLCAWFLHKKRTSDAACLRYF